MPEVAPFRTLSKSDFTLARTCPTKLYYRELRYPTVDDDDPYLRMLAQGGYMVETVAKLRFPEGIALEYGGNVVADAEITAEHLTRASVTLFEATLLSGRKQARVDILRKSGNTFDVIEVKSKSFDSAEHHALLMEGKKGVFRAKRKPFGVNTDWEKYIADVAFQVLVLRELYPAATIRPFLYLVDKAKVTKIDGLPGWFRVEHRLTSSGRENIHRVQFTGDVARMRDDDFLTMVDVSEEVELMMEQVKADVTMFETSIRGDLQRLPAKIGYDCRKCEFRFNTPVDRHGFAECWGELASVTPSVLDLYWPTEAVVQGMVDARTVSLFDVDPESLTRVDGSIGDRARRQLVQIEHTKSGTIWFADELRDLLASVKYPLHFIDFEAARLAIPPHAGMRPYGQLAFQWSCHSVERPGAPLTHREWLNTVDMWPNAKFARTLREVVGTGGTVMAWARFECSTLRDTLSELDRFGESDPGLEQWLEWITEKDRILDLNQVTLDHFFHPGMGGRTSIKVVLDALWKSDAAMRARFRDVMGYDGDPLDGPYAALPSLVINGCEQQVAEGTGAIRAYEAMMYGAEREDAETREQWSTLLKQYCRLDTLAMVLIWEYWGRLAPQRF